MKTLSRTCSYTKGVICTFLLLISNVVLADWTDISNDVEITKTRPAFDRVNRVYFVYLDVKNTSANTLNGPFRVLIDNSTIPVTKQSGDTETGIPFFDVTNEGIEASETIRVRVEFLAQRKALAFDVIIEALSSPPSVAIYGIVGIEPIVGASVHLKSLSGDTVASTTTDHEGKYNIEVSESDIASGYELFATKGMQGKSEFKGEMRAIYSFTDDRDNANITLITTLINKLSLIHSPLSIEQRNIEIKKLVDLGLITPTNWLEMTMSTVDLVALQKWVDTRGIDNWLNDMLSDLSDGELSQSMMNYFAKAHGGLSSISFSPSVSIALFPGQSRNIFLTPIFKDEVKATTTQIISGPSWITIFDEKLVIKPEINNTNYDVFTVEIEIKENNSIVGRKKRFDVSLIEPVTLLTGELDSLGGKIESEWKDFIISVPENVLTQRYSIKYFAGLDGNGGIKFGLISVPEMSVNEKNNLMLIQPAIDVIKNNYLDEVSQNESSKLIINNNSFSTSSQTKVFRQTDSASNNNEQKYGELQHNYKQYYQSGVIGSGLPIKNVCRPGVTGDKLNEMVWLNENITNDDYNENGDIVDSHIFPYVLEASSAMFDESTQFSVAESKSGGYPRLQKNQSFRVKEAQERCASALRSAKSVEFDYSEYEAVLFVHGFINTGQLGGYNGDGLIFDSGSEYFHNFPSIVEKITTASGKKYMPFIFQWRTNAKFEDVASELGSAILMLNLKTGRKVHIVAHSFGGILTRVFAQGFSSSVFYDENLAEGSIASITTVGTPHSGTFGTQTNVEFFDDQEQSKGVLGFPEGRNGPAGALIDNCRAITCYQTGSGKHADGKYSSDGGIGNSELFGTDSIAGKVVYNLANNLESYPQIATQALIGLVPDERNSSTSEDDNYNISYDFLFDSATANPGAGDRLISIFGQRLVPTTENKFLAPMYASQFIEEHILPMNTRSDQFYRGMDDNIVSKYTSGKGVDDDWTIENYATNLLKSDLKHYVYGFNHRTGEYDNDTFGIEIAERLTEVGLHNCSNSSNCNHPTWNYFTSFILDEGEDVTLPQEIKVSGSVISDNVPFEDLVVRIYVPDSNDGEIIGLTSVDPDGKFEKYVSFRKNTAYWITVRHKSNTKVRIQKSEEVSTSTTLKASFLNFPDIPVVGNTDEVVTANLNIMAIDGITNDELLGYTVKIYNSEGFIEEVISQGAKITINLPIGRYTLLANLTSYNQVLKVCNVLIYNDNTCIVEFGSSSLDDGLVAYYPFEGNANDASGNGHDGEETGINYYVDGTNNQGLNITDDGQYVTVPHDASSLTSNLTFSVWFKTLSLNNTYNTILDKTDGSDYSLTVSDDESGGLQLIFKVFNQLSQSYEVMAASIPPNQWIHASVVKSGSKFVLYVNSQNNGEFNVEDYLIKNNPLIIGAGGSPFSAGYNFNGYIDDLRIYNRALTINEITQLYSKGLNARYDKELFHDDFNSSDPLTDLWSITTPSGGSEIVAGYDKESGKLKLTINGQSDGYMGVADRTHLSPKNVNLADDFYIESNITELSRSKNNGYKDNSGIGIQVQDNNGNIIAAIGISGNYSGYFDGYNYDEYQGHRIHGTNNYLKEVDLNTFYNISFRIYRNNKKIFIGSKLQSEIDWTDFLVSSESIEQLKPFLGVGSGDGGYTRKNGNFSAEVEYFKVNVQATNVVLGVTFTDEQFAICVQEHVNSQQVTSLADLTSLDCHARNITNVAELSHMTGLVSLYLQGNAIASINLDANQALNTADLRNNNLSDESLAYLETVTWIDNLTYQTTPDLEMDLVAYYPFEGNANDYSGNEHHGEENGGVSYVEGMIGKAAKFDGVDDYIELPASIISGSEFTVGFWLNRQSVHDGILSGSKEGSSNEFTLYLDSTANIELHYNTSQSFYSTGVETTQNTWQHVTLVKNHAQSTIYINGISSWTIQDSEVTNITLESLFLGIEADCVGGCFEDSQYFNGSIDSLRIYNRAITSTEVTELYEFITPDLERGLVAYYPFDGNANDASGNGHDGVENGGVTYIKGVIGNAAKFDGIDDYINLGDALLPTDQFDSFSVSLLVTPDNLITQQAIFSQYDSGSGRLHLVQKNGNVLWLFMGGSDSEHDHGIEYNLTTIETAHLVIIKSGMNVSLYVDGNYINSFITDIGIANTQALLGKDTNVGNFNFKGKIDELRIYNRALNQSEISELYEANAVINLEKGLIAKYEMNGNGNDSSGNNNHALLSGASITEDREGNNNSALYFDGDDVMNAGNLSINSNAITLSIWAKLDSEQVTAGGDIIPFFNKHQSIHLQIDDKKLDFSIGSGVAPKISVNSLPVDNTWTHIVATYDGTNMKVYLNGNLVGNKVYTEGVLLSNYPLYIASDEVGNFQYLSGSVDDALIYNRALSQSEITELYELSGTEKPSEEVIFDSINQRDWFASRAKSRNAENWSAVNFTDNYVMLNQDQTDNGPSLLSVGILPVDGKKLKISRKLELHSHITYSFQGGNEFFVGGINIYSSGNSDKLSTDNSFLEGMCQVRYYDYEYQGDWDTFFLNNKDDISTHIPSIWDEQFVETFIYDPQSGISTYQVGSNIVTADCEPLNQDYIRIYIQTYGWWTGHYTKIYDFDVRWID